MTDFIQIGHLDLTLDTALLMSEGKFISDINLQEIDLHLHLVNDKLTNLDRIFSSNTNIIGRITGEISVTGEGNSIPALMKNLNGKILLYDYLDASELNALYNCSDFGIC